MAAQIEGLVVCRVGDERLAFAAASVGQITDWAVGDVPAPHARTAFALPIANGRRIEDRRATLVVDSLEIASDAVPLMPVPAMLVGAVGGALRGFAVLAGQLYPVLAVAEFAAWLSARGDA